MQPVIQTYMNKEPAFIQSIYTVVIDTKFCWCRKIQLIATFTEGVRRVRRLTLTLAEYALFISNLFITSQYTSFLNL